MFLSSETNLLSHFLIPYQLHISLFYSFFALSFRWYSIFQFHCSYVVLWLRPSAVICLHSEHTLFFLFIVHVSVTRTRVTRSPARPPFCKNAVRYHSYQTGFSQEGQRSIELLSVKCVLGLPQALRLSFMWVAEQQIFSTLSNLLFYTSFNVPPPFFVTCFPSWSWSSPCAFSFYSSIRQFLQVSKPSYSDV
jgi:hypothetical protein